MTRIIPHPLSIFQSLNLFIDMSTHIKQTSTNVPRSYDDSLSKWCATQRLRCKEILNGNENIKTPMTRVQFQMLENIGFDMSMKRKSYDRSVLDKKWDDKL